jgi:UDP-glucose 4-epimerase
MARILVTGATGFCGRPLVQALCGAGYEVRAPSRGEADLADQVDWQPFLADVDAVVHLAAITTNDTASEADYDQVNHRGTERLALAAHQAGVRHFIFMSSVSAQSPASAAHPLSETDEPRPHGAYGRSKLAAEHAVRASGVPFTILRPVMIYGPPVGYLTRLARIASTPLPLPFGAFRNRRSLLGTENLVSAVLFLLLSGATNATFLLADPDPIALPEIIGSFRRGLGRRPMIFPFPSAPLRWLMGGSGSELIVRPTRLIAAGWKPVADTPALLARGIRSPAE